MIVLVSGVAFVYIHTKNIIKSQTEDFINENPYLLNDLGNINGMDINISEYSPICQNNDCERYLVTVHGSKASIYIETDVSFAEGYMYNMVVCDEQKNIILKNDNIPENINTGNCR